MSFIPIPIRDNLVYFIGKQGCTWSCTIALSQVGVDPPTPIDLTEYSVRGQIRKTFADASPIAEFICAKVDDIAGKLNILLEAETTADLTACKASVDSTNYTSADKTGQPRWPPENPPLVAGSKSPTLGDSRTIEYYQPVLGTKLIPFSS